MAADDGTQSRKRGYIPDVSLDRRLFSEASGKLPLTHVHF